MTVSEIKTYLHQHQPGKVKFAFADIDGVLRGKVISAEKMLDVLDYGAGFCDVIFGWDSSDALYNSGNTLTGWHTGFPDRTCHLDLSTFRTIPWQHHLPFFLADFSQEPGTADAACSRSLLKRVVASADEMGFVARFAQEFEWFNFDETPTSLSDKNYQQPRPISPGMFGYSSLRPSQFSDFYYDLFDQLTAFGVPIEGLHTETGPGVYEAAIHHDTTVAAADKATLFKMAVKEIASLHGITASFMAKWNKDLPGCSGHIHQSLWNKDETQNLFYEDGAENKMSLLMKQYVAGQLFCLPHLLPMYAPTINSYKRLVEGAWAPTTITWGIDNRTTAVRVINPYEKAMRVEMRVPGSDTNPYLAFAASLASGLYGIRHQLSLTIPETIGNGYAVKENGVIPSNLYEATVAMQHSAIAEELFGAPFVQHFAETRMHEWKQFAAQVTDWEIRRYFEII